MPLILVEASPRTGPPPPHHLCCRLVGCQSMERLHGAVSCRLTHHYPWMLGTTSCLLMVRPLVAMESRLSITTPCTSTAGKLSHCICIVFMMHLSIYHHHYRWMRPICSLVFYLDNQLLLLIIPQIQRWSARSQSHTRLALQQRWR